MNGRHLTCIGISIKSFGLDLASFSQKVIAAFWFRRRGTQAYRWPVVDSEQLFWQNLEGVDESGHGRFYIRKLSSLLNSFPD